MRIHMDEIDWDDPMMQTTARYKSSKFTGVAYNDWNGYYSENSYKDGERHGRSYCVNNLTGELENEEFYDRGIPVKTHFNWYDNGEKKKIDSFDNGVYTYCRVENKEGKKLLEYKNEKLTITEWYENGTLRSVKQLEEGGPLYLYTAEDYWTQGGVWLASISDRKLVKCNDEFLFHKSIELSSEEHEVVFIAYPEFLLKEQTRKGFEYLIKNMNHPNGHFRYQSARLAAATNGYMLKPYLKKLLKDDSIPERPNITDWLQMGSSSRTQYSIGEMAKRAIRSINKRQAYEPKR